MIDIFCRICSAYHVSDECPTRRYYDELKKQREYQLCWSVLNVPSVLDPQPDASPEGWSRCDTCVALNRPYRDVAPGTAKNYGSFRQCACCGARFDPVSREQLTISG